MGHAGAFWSGRFSFMVGKRGRITGLYRGYALGRICGPGTPLDKTATYVNGWISYAILFYQGRFSGLRYGFDRRTDDIFNPFCRKSHFKNFRVISHHQYFSQRAIGKMVLYSPDVDGIDLWDNFIIIWFIA